MVVIYRGYNNHSNRLFQAIHIESFCMANDIKFCNPSFWDMAKYYGIKQGFLDRVFSYIIHILCKILLINGLKLNDIDKYNEYSELLKNRKLVFVRDWKFSNYQYTQQYREYFSNKYRLLPSYYQGNPLYIKIQSLDRSCTCLVGIHIRRGDYLKWENGKYYFDDTVYQRYINNFEKEIITKTGKNALFIIFSNEKITLEMRENILFSHFEWYIDQFLLSLCDFIIGPVSTFTLWSSYVGKVKYFHITDDSGSISLDNFQQCIG
jgi:hypothetical protein